MATEKHLHDYAMWMAQAEVIGVSPDVAAEAYEAAIAVPSDSPWQPISLEELASKARRERKP